MRTDGEIGAILKRRVDEQRRSPGVAVGIVSAEGRRRFAYGAAAERRSASPDTLFEIGSITKPLTALLLCDAVRRRELRLDDPVRARLPAGAAIPAFEGREITLAYLALHQSGLPSFLPGMPGWGTPEWATYSKADLLADVGRFQLTRPIGSAWEYSNTGYGLIGLALEQVGGAPYETLLAGRVLAPLGMTDTTFALTPAQEARAAEPHAADGAPAPRLSISSMAPAGGAWSTIDDMMTLAAAAMGLASTPLAETSLAGAMADMLTRRRPHAAQGVEQAIGWLNGFGLTGHNGGTIGMASSLFFDPAGKLGVVALANASGDTMNFAINLIRPEAPGDDGPPLVARTAIALASEALDRCVGRYQMGPGAVAEVTRDAAGLVVKAPTTPPLALLAESASTFFSNFVPLTLDFELPAEGPASAVMIHFGGQDIPAPRLAD